MPFLIKTFRRLQQRGHKPELLKKIFVQAITSIFGSTNIQPKKAEKDTKDKIPLYLQLPFNPADPHRKTFQKSFRDNILHPKNKKPIKQEHQNTRKQGNRKTRKQENKET